MRTFETFKVEENNKLAYAMALTVADMTKPVTGVVSITGPRNSGKSHLLDAIEAEVTKKYNGAVRVARLTGEQFMKEYTDSVTYGEVADYMEGFTKVNVLIMDDALGLFESDDEPSITMFNRLLTGLKNKGSRIVLGLGESFDVEAMPEGMKEHVATGIIVTIEA